MLDFSAQARVIDAEVIRAEANDLLSPNLKITHDSVLREILDSLEPLDFRAEAGLDSGDNLSQKHQVVLTVSAVLAASFSLQCGLCRNQDFIYTYNGEYWKQVDREMLKTFLGEAAEKLGVEIITAKYHKFRDELYKQFLMFAHLPKPENESETVVINLQNGTFEITEKEFYIRDFRREDFLTYQLPFEYEPNAAYPKWQAFLDEVLPDKSKQDVLAEYIGYVFARHLKLEKTLILFGTGANGKSVVFEVINALLGKENITNYSLEALGGNYYRAMIANKLLNYSSEISNRLQAEKFKQLTSGEPVEARLPYGQPFTLYNYARLAFNCNELPKDVEHSEAFFRRFLIIPFDITIPEYRRNPNLPKEIISTELSGVFNWMLDGLKRLLRQNGFSPCDAVQKMVENFRRESNSVAMFIEDEEYQKSSTDFEPLKDLYPLYRNYCQDNGFRAVNSKNLAKRLEELGFESEKKSFGKVFYLKK